MLVHSLEFLNGVICHESFHAKLFDIFEVVESLCSFQPILFATSTRRRLQIQILGSLFERFVDFTVLVSPIVHGMARSGVSLGGAIQVIYYWKA